jgi:hypothetical protein
MDRKEEIYSVSIIRDKKSGVAVGEVWSYRSGPPSDPLLPGGGWKIHRPDAPAITRRHPETGAITEEEWYSEGRRHRTDGPAIIRRDSVSGKQYYTSWYRDGVQIPSRRRPNHSTTHVPQTAQPRL